MGLREQFEMHDIITDEGIARGIVYAWTLVVVADEKVEGVEMKSLEEFAKTHNITKQFNQDDWLSETVGQALSVYKTEGEDALFEIIEELLKGTGEENKLILLTSLLQLACVDGDFDTKELLVLERIADMLDISRQDTLMVAMAFATGVFRKINPFR